MHHKRKLNFNSFSNNKKENIWSLFWYGRISFKAEKSKFYIEAYFALMKKDDFYLNNLDGKIIEKLEFPFTKSILFPLSSQFDFEGNFLRMSNIFNKEGEILKNGLYKFENVSLNNSYNFKISGLENAFSSSLFPEVVENGNSIYQEAPHFIRKIKFEKEGKNFEIQYIIPVDVVLKYFFGFSSLILDLLITDRLRHAIRDIKINANSDEYRLYFDSELITRSDANSIAKYFFTKDKFAQKLLLDIGAYFSKVKFNNQKIGSFIKFKIPFDIDCRFSFVGQYFSKNEKDSKLSKIIVNEILDVVAKDDFFITNSKIDLIDINSSTHLDEAQTTLNSRGMNRRDEVNLAQEEEREELPLNSNSNDSVEVRPIELRRNFLQSPQINDLILTANKNEEIIFLGDKKVEEQSNLMNYDGLKRRKIINISNINWIEILDAAVQILVVKHGYKENRLTNRIEGQLNNKIVIQLMYENVSYYIIDSGGNNYFPLFRNANKNETINFEVINQIIEVISDNYNSSWVVVSNKKSLRAIEKFSSIQFLQNNDIYFLRNNTHELIGNLESEDVIEKTIENLANKIHKKILSDFNSLS